MLLTVPDQLHRETAVWRSIGDPHIGRKVREFVRQHSPQDLEELVRGYREASRSNHLSSGRAATAMFLTQGTPLTSRLAVRPEGPAGSPRSFGAVNPRPPLPLAELNSALAAARRCRAEWLLSMEAGVLRLAELVSHATTESGAPLRAIHLAEILRTQPGWGRRRTRVAMETLRRRTQVPGTTPNHRLTVGWLVDRRGSGHRLAALCDQLTSDTRSAPSDEFPYAPVAASLPPGRLYQSPPSADTFETWS